MESLHRLRIRSSSIFRLVLRLRTSRTMRGYLYEKDDRFYLLARRNLALKWSKFTCLLLVLRGTSSFLCFVRSSLNPLLCRERQCILMSSYVSNEFRFFIHLGSMGVGPFGWMSGLPGCDDSPHMRFACVGSAQGTSTRGILKGLFTSKEEKIISSPLQDVLIHEHNF